MRAATAAESSDAALAGVVADMLERLREEQPWRKLAVCANEELDTSLFYPSVGLFHTAVKGACARCPVREECRAEGRARVQPGYWGGESERARKRLRQEVPLPHGTNTDMP